MPQLMHVNSEITYHGANKIIDSKIVQLKKTAFVNISLKLN